MTFNFAQDIGAKFHDSKYCILSELFLVQFVNEIQNDFKNWAKLSCKNINFATGEWFKKKYKDIGSIANTSVML